MQHALVLFVLGLFAAACQASVQADARMSSDAVADPTDGSDDGEPHAMRALAGAGELDAPPRVLLGARRDLQLRSTDGAIRCGCVQVVLGPATLPQFAWQDGAPPTLPDTQLVLAFRPDETCPGAPEGSDGASYWGYRIEGDDVVVLLEPLVKGPPRTLGAVLPRPPSGGQVYVAPAQPGLPFGLPPSGEGTRCALGNPGPKRSTPFTPAETGAL